MRPRVFASLDNTPARSNSLPVGSRSAARRMRASRRLRSAAPPTVASRHSSISSCSSAEGATPAARQTRSRDSASSILLTMRSISAAQAGRRRLVTSCSTGIKAMGNIVVLSPTPHSGIQPPDFLCSGGRFKQQLRKSGDANGTGRDIPVLPQFLIQIEGLVVGLRERTGMCGQCGRMCGRTMPAVRWRSRRVRCVRAVRA